MARPPVRHQPTQQQLLALRIKRLKSLIDVDIEFDENKPLTAILGPNGFGKSSILHALAASFTTPVMQSGEDYRFTDFFPNTPHGYWAGTDFTVAHRYRLGEIVRNETTRVRKETSQWLPLKKSLPKREVYFIGVNSAVPKIEVQRTRLRINYVTNELSDEKSLEVRQKAGLVFNRDYTKYHSNEVTRNKKFIGVEYRGVNFSALSMGAGEQRVFEILKTVVFAGKYSLLLIDEIDLLLHGDALTRFLKILNEYANDKKIQIIFTTHREQVLEFEDTIAVRHIYQLHSTIQKTFCFYETKPEAITRLTGRPHRPLFVACEDDVSKKIIEQVSSQYGIRKFTEISCFGAADNSFTLIAALLLGEEPLENSIFIIDGDRFETDALKSERMDKVLTGNHPADAERRRQALSYIRQYVPPEIEPPEKRLHALANSLVETGDHAIDEVINAVRQVVVVANDHEYIDKTIEILGDSRETGLQRIVSVAAKAAGWNEYVAPVAEWFAARAPQLREQLQAGP